MLTQKQMNMAQIWGFYYCKKGDRFDFGDT